MCHVLKTPHQKGGRFSLSSSSERKQKLPTGQHSQGRNPVGLVSHEVICGPRPLHIDMAYYDWLAFSWVPSPEFTEVDILLEGGGYRDCYHIQNYGYPQDYVQIVNPICPVCLDRKMLEDQPRPTRKPF